MMRECSSCYRFCPCAGGVELAGKQESPWIRSRELTSLSEADTRHG